MRPIVLCRLSPATTPARAEASEALQDRLALELYRSVPRYVASEALIAALLAASWAAGSVGRRLCPPSSPPPHAATLLLGAALIAGRGALRR